MFLLTSPSSDRFAAAVARRPSFSLVVVHRAHKLEEEEEEGGVLCWVTFIAPNQIAVAMPQRREWHYVKYHRKAFEELYQEMQFKRKL